MFPNRQRTLAARLLDGVDLAIEFATLGEYGLPAGRNRVIAMDATCGAGRPARPRRRPARDRHEAASSAGQHRRGVRRRPVHSRG